nr:hypothetical protein [Candidatus Sigynarchaeum springense]
MTETSTASWKPWRTLVVDDPRKQLFTGACALAIMQAAMGVFMILASRFLSMLPLNTPGVYETIGRFDHVLGLRYWTSLAFFGLAAFTIIASLVYMQNPDNPVRKATARALAVVIQPWIAIALLVVAALWLVQALDPDGDVAQIFAPLYGIDVEDPVGRAHYLYILGGLPIVEFLFFSIGNIILLPFSFYTSAMLLQDTRAVAIPGKPFSDDYEQRHRQYAAKGLFNGGILAIIIGVAIYGIGFLLGYGLDATWPLFPLSNYPMYMNVYPWFPVAFGAVCMATSIAYYVKPVVQVPRVLAWYCALVLLLVPVVGWFFGINLIINLHETGKNLEKKNARQQLYFGLFAAVLSILVPLAVFLVI